MVNQNLIEIIEKINENIKFELQIKILKNIGDFSVIFNDETFVFKALPLNIFMLSSRYYNNSFFKYYSKYNDFILFIYLLENAELFFTYYDLSNKSINLTAYNNILKQIYEKIGSFKKSVFRTLISEYVEKIEIAE